MNYSIYEKLRILGPISVKLATWEEAQALNRIRILLIGPTGAGKSAFIECIGGDPSMGISGDSLDSVTQVVSTYKLVNVKHRPSLLSSTGPISSNLHILDTPGVSDAHLSELHLVRLLQENMKQVAAPEIILYFHRITDKRLTGSQRRALRLIQALLGEPGRSYTMAGVVTTLWDSIPTNQLQVAEERFQRLKEDHLKEVFGSEERNYFQFHNTQDSALDIISRTLKSAFTDNPWDMRFSHRFPLEKFTWERVRDAPFAKPLIEMLDDRIEGLEQRKRVLSDDLAQQDTLANEELFDILSKEKIQVETLLQQLQKEKVEYLDLPETVSRPAVGKRITQYLRDMLH